MKRDYVKCVASADGAYGLKVEEITAFASVAEWVDILGACNVDEVVVEADALHAVDQIDERRLFHPGDFGA